MNSNLKQKTAWTYRCLYFLFSFFLVSCGGGGNDDPSPQVTPTTISGRVVDLVTGSAVQNASIWTVPGTSQTTTNSNGSFGIQNGIDRNIDQYQVYATAAGYGTDFSIISANNGDFATAEIQLSTEKTGLSATPSTLRFSNNEQTKTFFLTSSIDNTDFSIESTASWLSVTPVSGVIDNAKGERRVITVTIDRTALALGNYAADLVINSSNVSGTTASILMAVNSELPVVDEPATSNNLIPQDDNVSVQAGSIVSITPLDNDAGTGLQLIDSFTQPTKGSVIRSGRSFVYTANNDANGTDSFVYTVVDDDGNSANATVVISITNNNTSDESNPDIPNIPLSVINTEGFKVVLKSCQFTGSDLDCDLEITREGAPTSLWIECGGSRSRSRLIDENGIEYISNQVRLGVDVDTGTFCRAQAKFDISGLRLKAGVRYKNVPKDMINPQLIQIGFIFGTGRFTGSPFSTLFTDVRLAP